MGIAQSEWLGKRYVLAGILLAEWPNAYKQSP
jgi:hypothetical protein